MNSSGKKQVSRIRPTRRKPASEVGYCRPPPEHQFKPGQSGNPKGRPKGRRNEATILQELLSRKIAIREGGKVRKVPVIEAILLRIAEDSLKGNTKSANFILNRYAAVGSGESLASALTEDDREILDAYACRLISEQAIKR